MITYWTDEPGTFGMREYLASRGLPLADRIAVRCYESLGHESVLNGGAHIFSALDQLTPAGRALVGEVWDRVRQVAPEWSLLNDPRTVLLRTPLLQSMARLGLNSFAVHPAAGSLDDVRYPVFIREANRHTGSRTRLLESPGEVRRALRALQWRGMRLRDLLVVEYVHTGDAEGHYRKYASYRVGKALVRTHLMIGNHWLVKSGGDQVSVAFAKEMHRYLHEQQHEAWLDQVFTTAGIDYGRIDYGVVNGQPQVWEINLNPTITRRAGQPARTGDPEALAIRDEAREHAHHHLREAFRALDPGHGPSRVTVSLPESLLRQVNQERRTVRRRNTVVGLATRMGDLPLLGSGIRSLYSRVFPRG